MMAEINKSLDDFGAAIAFFFVTAQKALSYCIHPPFERRVRSGALFAAASQPRLEIAAEVLDLSIQF